jgi:hypothetical protein
MPLQRDSLSAHRATLALDGLPLHRLPEDERSAFSLSIAVPANGFELTRGETVLGGLSRDMHHFCPRCISWMFTRPIGMDWFVNVRATMLDEHGWFEPFAETFNRENLPWAATAAKYSYQAIPGMAEYEKLTRAYAKEGARPSA